MTEVEVLQAFRCFDPVSYLDGDGAIKQGVCVGWGQSPINRQRYMLVESSNGLNMRRVPLSHIIRSASKYNKEKKYS